MGESVLARLFEKRSTTSNPAQWFVDWIRGGSESSSGVNVSEDSALKHSPFWAAIRVISGAVSSLPLLTYQRQSDGNKDRATSHPVYKLLHDKPNQYMTAGKFYESRTAHALIYGNGYAEIQRDGGGRPIALWPLLPDRVARDVTESGVPFYRVMVDAGNIVTVADANMLHIPGLGANGYVGYPVVQYQKEAIGLGVATKQFGARFFSNDANPGGVLEHPGKLDDEAHKRLKKSWAAVHSGLDNAHRVAILEEGLKWAGTGVSPEAAQAIETQKFSVDDIARIFNLPPHMIGSMDSATFTNIEQQKIDFLTRTLVYWLRIWESEIDCKLFSAAEQKTFFVEFLMDSLLRGDSAARSTAYTAGRMGGWLSVNDVRRFENMNSIGEKGDEYLVPFNMRVAGEEPPEPAPPALPAPAEDDDEDQERHRPQFEQLWRRMITKEVNALQTAAKKGNAKDKAVREFYDKHEQYMLEVLGPALFAYCGNEVEVAAEVVLEYKRARVMRGRTPRLDDVDMWVTETLARGKEYGKRKAKN